MTMYELNQANYHNLPKMSKSQVETARDKIIKWLDHMDETLPSIENLYLMLLNNESHYYTVFNWSCAGISTSSQVADEILSIAKDLGTLKSIEKTNNDQAFEFWITGQDAVTRMYALFNYTEGVIEL